MDFTSYYNKTVNTECFVHIMENIFDSTEI